VLAGFARKRKLVNTAYSVLNISFLTRLSHMIEVRYVS
jgi:hypothetical protein